MKDYVDDVKEVMARKRFRDFPIVERKREIIRTDLKTTVIERKKKNK